MVFNYCSIIIPTASSIRFITRFNFQAWHLLGTITLLSTYPLIFLPPIGFIATEHETQATIYYSVFNALFQMGFSMAQINHLAMIPELCSSEDERTSLTLIRNSTTSMANIVAYLIAFIAFSHGKNHTNLDVRGMNKSF